MEIPAWFQRISGREVRLLIGGATQQSFRRGDTIIEEGALLCAAFVIRQGYVRVKTSQGKGITLAILGPGEVFGEMSFLERTAASASVLAPKRMFQSMS
jgi:extracellular factor (EF) 3-hydroxypalmitic acid methyl ester biosynthesis protein